MDMFHIFKTNKANKQGIHILGGKGYNLFRMKDAGLEVPPAVIIPTTACVKYMKRPGLVMNYVREYVIPEIVKFHGFKNGELVSVRSGAKVSMPGMMDTILNVGLTSSTANTIVKVHGERTMFDSCRRLIQMFGSVVDGIPHHRFEQVLEAMKQHEGVNSDVELSADALATLCHKYGDIYASATQTSFPDTIEGQLEKAIEAVFKSWNNERAVYYRNMNKIPHDMGTAVVVQRMVFGNLNDASCTGVLFTRDPSSGANTMLGEFLINAQGEDVVAGIRTPQPLAEMAKWDFKVYEQLIASAKKMEQANGDMQDMEFTVEDGKLYFLQTRNGKRTGEAAIHIAADLFTEGLIDWQTAKSRLSYDHYLMARKPKIALGFNKEADATGLPASNGVAKGVAAFSSEFATKCKVPCILLGKETTPDDIAGMYASVGILTSTGGATSHAAVVARGMDKVCIVGCSDLQITTGNPVSIGGKAVIEGKTMLCLDGSTGRVWVDEDVPVLGGDTSPAVQKLLGLMQDPSTTTVVLTYDQAKAFPAAPSAEQMVMLTEQEVFSLNAPDLMALYAKGFRQFFLRATPAEDFGVAAADLSNLLVGESYSSMAVAALIGLTGKADVTIMTNMSKVSLPSGSKAVIIPIGENVDLEALLMAPAGSFLSITNPSPAVQKVLELKKLAGESVKSAVLGAIPSDGSSRGFVGIPMLMKLALS